MEAIGVRYVNTDVDPLTLRNKPSTSGSVVTRMERAAKVTLLQEHGDWCYVRYGQYEGYCATRYLSLRKPEQSARDTTPLLDATLTAVSGWGAVVGGDADSTLFIREWCSLAAPEVTEVQPGTVVALLRKGDVWCQISLEGKSGYCLTSKLVLTPPAE